LKTFFETFFTFTAFVGFFLFFFNRFDFSNLISSWWIIIAIGFLGAAATIINLKVYNHLDVSLIALLSKLTTVFSVIFSIILLNETLTIWKFFGGALIIIGAVLLTFKHKKSYNINKTGLYLLFLVIVLYSLGSIVDKLGVTVFNIFTYGFFAYFSAFLLILSYLLFTRKGLLIKTDAKLVILVSILNIGAYLLLLYAYSITSVINVSIFSNLSVIAVIIGGYLFHKEKGILNKSFAAILMIIGAVLASF